MAALLKSIIILYLKPSINLHLNSLRVVLGISALATVDSAIIRLIGAGVVRSITKQTKNLKNFRHWNYELSQIGFKTTEYNSHKIVEWYLVKYLCQGGFSEGRRWPALSWLHDRSCPQRSCFVSYLEHAFENKNFK